MEGRGRRCDEGEGVGGGVVADFGSEDGVGYLEFAEGVLEEGMIWGFGEEEG